MAMDKTDGGGGLQMPGFVVKWLLPGAHHFAKMTVMFTWDLCIFCIAIKMFAKQRNLYNQTFYLTGPKVVWEVPTIYT
jgi:hypothetical protein